MQSRARLRLKASSRKVVFLDSGDLFFRAKLDGIARSSGAIFECVDTISVLCGAKTELAESIVIYDLEKVDLKEILQLCLPNSDGGFHLLGFYSHKNREVSERARQAGVRGEMVPKSALEFRLRKLLSQDQAVNPSRGSE